MRYILWNFVQSSVIVNPGKKTAEQHCKAQAEKKSVYGDVHDGKIEKIGNYIRHVA